ncbi:MAG: hypothetical protein HY040_24510 [Planctomycetes bacterium]|nr:hypothetical protein [Planctomycetota bacterium]
MNAQNGTRPFHHNVFLGGRWRNIAAFMVAGCAVFCFFAAWMLAWNMAMQGPESERAGLRDLSLAVSLIGMGCLASLGFVAFFVFDALAQIRRLLEQAAPSKVTDR